jgi:hypothetical protein
MTFTYPANTGISYSFSEDGFFEEAQYRYDSNATNPTCIRGKIIWQHGTYVINSDGSLDLTPFSTDGRIQVQDPCAAVTNVVTYYDETEKMRSYDVYVDQVSASYTLQLYQFDGTPMPPVSRSQPCLKREDLPLTISDVPDRQPTEHDADQRPHWCQRDWPNCREA